MKPGFVYIAIRPDGVFKIGASIAPQSRMKSLGQLSPGIKLVHTIESADHKHIEEWLHTAFAHRLIKYEWYALDLFDVELLKSVVKMNSPADAPPWLAELHRLNEAGELLMPFADSTADLPQARIGRTGFRRVEVWIDNDVYERLDALRRTLGRSMRDEIEEACERHLSSPPEPPPPPPPPLPIPPLPPVTPEILMLVKRGRGRPRKNPVTA